MAINQSQLRTIILEEIQNVLSEGLTPEKRKALKAEYNSFDDKIEDLEDEMHELNIDLDSPQFEGPANKQKRAAARAKLEKIKAQHKDLVTKQEAVRKRLGASWDPRNALSEAGAVRDDPEAKKHDMYLVRKERFEAVEVDLHQTRQEIQKAKKAGESTDKLQKKLAQQKEKLKKAKEEMDKYK